MKLRAFFQDDILFATRALSENNVWYFIQSSGRIYKASSQHQEKFTLKYQFQVLNDLYLELIDASL